MKYIFYKKIDREIKDVVEISIDDNENVSYKELNAYKNDDMIDYFHQFDLYNRNEKSEVKFENEPKKYLETMRDFYSNAYIGIK